METSEEAVVIYLEQGERVLQKALELCSVYPGDIQIHGQGAIPIKPSSLRLDDFQLSNIVVSFRASHFHLSPAHHTT